MNKEHFQHRGVGVQQDGLSFGDDGKRALLRWRQTAPREPGRPHVNVEEICIILKKETNRNHVIKLLSWSRNRHDTVLGVKSGVLTVLSYHLGDAAVSDADSDFGFLRLPLRVCHTDDVCVVGGLDVTHGPCDGHADFVHVGAAGWESE